MVKKRAVEPPARGRGRPATGRAREIKMVIRMNAAERAVIEAAAAKEGMKPTVWGLGAMLAVAKMTKKN